MINALRARLRSPVATILVGSLVGQGAVLAVSPALTRLYSREDFAALAAITAASVIVGAVSTMSWDRAIVVPADEDTARDLLCLGMLAVAAVTLALALCAFALRERVAQLFGSSVFEDFWWLLPLTVAAMGLFSLASACLVRARNYRSIGIRNAVQGGSQALSGVALGAVGLAPLGLVSSLLIGRAAALLRMARTLGEGLRRITHPRALWRAAVRYRKFPLVSTASRLLNSLGLQLPMLCIIVLFASVEAGVFALTVRVLASPVGIVADAVSQSFEGEFSHRLRSGSRGLRKLLVRTCAQLLAICAIPVLIIVAFGPWIFSWAFGPAWEDAGHISQVMIAAYAAQFTVAPISRVLLVLEKQGTLLGWDVLRAVATVSAVILPSVFGLGFMTVVYSLTAAQVCSYGLLYVLCARAAGSCDAMRREQEVAD